MWGVVGCSLASRVWGQAQGVMPVVRCPLGNKAAAVREEPAPTAHHLQPITS